MNPTLIDDVLATVEEDHTLVAEQLRILNQLHGTISQSDERDLELALELLESASRFFQTRLIQHFQEEERGMFLLFRACLPPGCTVVYELEAEHEEMRRVCERLHTDLSLLRHHRHRKPPLLADLEQVCKRLADTLSHHAERETGLIELLRKSAGPQQHEVAKESGTRSQSKRELACFEESSM